MLAIKSTPVKCCARCTSIVVPECNIDLSDLSAAGMSCQICALLLSAAKAHCHDEQQRVTIVREESWLKMGSTGPRILRLCSTQGQCLHPTYMYRGNPLLTRMHISELPTGPYRYFPITTPSLLEVGSPICFALLQEWLDQCNSSHDCMQRNVVSKLALPSRLLSLRNSDPNVLRLFCPKEKDVVKYAALSHSWGKLTDESKRQFCTTNDNIAERLEGFTFSELPKTFRDAIEVTRGLGIQYLWIDSLCIIQDNHKDWEHEAKLMEGVYASAYFTIAATSAVDSNAGFLEQNANNKYVYAQDASGRRFYICTAIDDFKNDVENAQLNKRAWVMQERVLSRRTIHFAAKQVYFECGQGIYCENFTTLKR
jgi:hypothetical protein